MYVVYKTNSLKYMMEIEGKLIDFYYDMNDNYSKGSAGPAPTQSNTYFVYVVVGRKKRDW